MIDRRKLLLYTLTPILAGSAWIGSASASHKKKKDASATTTQTTDASKTSTKKTSTIEKSKKTAKETTAEAKQDATKTTKESKGSTVSSSEIASAKSKGMVWVNTESKVYHTGGRYYGNTKHGQFMSEADAQKAGYKAAKK